jgi:hypothetical protein
MLRRTVVGDEANDCELVLPTKHLEFRATTLASTETKTPCSL